MPYDLTRAVPSGGLWRAPFHARGIRGIPAEKIIRSLLLTTARQHLLKLRRRAEIRRRPQSRDGGIKGKGRAARRSNRSGCSAPYGEPYGASDQSLRSLAESCVELTSWDTPDTVDETELTMFKNFSSSVDFEFVT